MPDNSSENDNPLLTPVQYLPGVGPQRAPLLQRLRLETAEDILFFLPRGVLDLTDVRPVHLLEKDVLQSVRGMVVDADAKSISGNRSMTAVLLDCEGLYLRGVWFNQPWMLKKFVVGQNVLFSGKPKRRSGRWEISNPKVQWLEEDADGAAGKILPNYRLTEGIKMEQMRRIVNGVVDAFAEHISDPLPGDFRAECDLIELRRAVRQLHQPASLDEYNAARHRLIFDDLLDFQVGLAMRRRTWRKAANAPRLPVSTRIDARIRRLFSFKFTDGQNSAVREICADLASGDSMHRLLQADVGAGKTAIAIYAMLVAIANGYQAILMAPTEVLANQHWATINAILSDSRVNRLCLTGSLTTAQRRKALAQIESGEANLIVGTQAVIQDAVKFHNPGVAIVDEQHKFGVMQRAKFTSGSVQPHVLVMTATPIPRSLCLTQFGDLDLSVISELPPGRQKIVTGRVVNETQRQKAWGFIRRQLTTGRQAYVVCPRVEESERDNDASLSGSAEVLFNQLRETELADFRVGLVHGRLDRDTKERVMDDFRDHEIDVLISTTVVEVGVDVPNATMMIIVEAERFGLSQLHQLRGRVGRGRFQSYCFLFSESETAEASARLDAMEETTDGFKIAEVDFALRGPGDVLGTRQSGDLPLRVANPLADAEVLKAARFVAFGLVEAGRIDEPEFAGLKERVHARFARIMNLPRSG